ncbi:MAG: VWA domain-containing protein [Gemmataceae bacterium]|nr:VWA domain-containing protein [Gemmataceae bacterium]
MTASSVTAWVRWFAQPWALWLLFALPALSLLFAWANWRRRRALRQLGAPHLVERLIHLRPRLRRWQSLALFFGLLGLIIAAAGPRWGGGAPPELLGGRDIVVALDLSKSMLAEQPSRLERARRSLRDLADGLEARGGHRVALVIFAAHAKVQFPLTRDYDHFRFAVEQLDPEALPPALRPQPGAKTPSGTRLGEALALAASLHDPKRRGWQDILLLSDGDDPADDDEWRRGIQAAHQQHMPIHVVAIGDPREPHPIRQGDDLLRHAGIVVQSKLNEPLLQEIARRTKGIYIPAHQTALPLGQLMRGYLESRPDRDEGDRDEPVAGLQAAPRYPWFLLPACVLLALTMSAGDGPKPRRLPASEAGGKVNGNANGKGAPPALVARWAVVLLLPFLISAAPLPPVEDLVRQGNAAFERREFDEALERYAEAAPASADPGLIAFNQAAALFRLGRFDEAAAWYQRCLEDGAIPPARRARANYDLGAALIRAGSDDRGRLEHAIAALRRCLDSGAATDLRADARHNLELAKWLWLKAKPAQTSQSADANQDPSNQGPEKQPHSQPRGNGEPKRNGVQNAGLVEGGPDRNGIDQIGLEAKQKKLAHGPLQVLPDNSKLTPLSSDETEAHLEQFLERMRRERRAYWRQFAAAPPDVKDW